MPSLRQSPFEGHSWSRGVKIQEGSHTDHRAMRESVVTADFCGMLRSVRWAGTCDSLILEGAERLCLMARLDILESDQVIL